MEFILNKPKGKERLAQTVTELTQAFGLAIPHPEALKIRNDVAFSRPSRLRRRSSKAEEEEVLKISTLLSGRSFQRQSPQKR